MKFAYLNIFSKNFLFYFLKDCLFFKNFLVLSFFKKVFFKKSYELSELLEVTGVLYNFLVYL